MTCVHRFTDTSTNLTNPDGCTLVALLDRSIRNEAMRNETQMVDKRRLYLRTEI